MMSDVLETIFRLLLVYLPFIFIIFKAVAVSLEAVFCASHLRETDLSG